MRLDDRAEIESALRWHRKKSYESARQSCSNLIRPIDRSAKNLRRVFSWDASRRIAIGISYTYASFYATFFFLGLTYTLFIYFNIKIKYFSIQFLVLRYSMSRKVLLASMPLRHWSRNAYPRQSKGMSLPTLCRKKGVAFPTISFPRSRFSRRQIDRMDWTQDSGA